jgi:hypothetical protein
VTPEQRIERLEEVLAYLLRFLSSEMPDKHIEAMQRMLSEQPLDEPPEA